MTTNRPLILLFLGGIFAAAAAGAYQEAPMLSERVARGELPSVDQRLPENPQVVEPVHSIGKYGGSWRRIAAGNLDFYGSSRLDYDPLVRWDRTGRKVAPGLAERWDIRDDGRTYVLYLRKGARWSDGAPFTSADLMFFYEDVIQNKELAPVFPTWLMIDDKPVEMTAQGDYAVEFRFAKPYGVFLEYIAFLGNSMYYPKHYLQQFHPRYTDVAKLEKLAKEKGLALWYQLFGHQANIEENPDLPSMRPFVLKTPPPATRVVYARNPYYWKVDPAGNQLPYIDEIAFTVVQNPEIANFKAMTGDADFQERRIDTANYTLFMENRSKGKYRVMRDFNPTATVVYINQYSKDPELRPILQDSRFRIALSVAINRQELIDLLYSGMAQPTRGVASAYDPFYLPEYDKDYLQYDPDLANRLLDEVGLPKGRDGLRRLPDGRVFRQILNVFPAETGLSADLFQLLSDYWREVGLDFVVKVDAGSLSVLQVCNGNSDFWAYLMPGMHWIVDPLWYVPWFPMSYFAPQFGRYRATGGKGGIKPPEEYQRLIDWYIELRSVVGDEPRKLEIGHRILGQWAEKCYVIGICRSELLTIVSNRFKNVPDHIIHDYRTMSPGYIGCEQFYIDEGESSAAVQDRRN